MYIFAQTHVCIYMCVCIPKCHTMKWYDFVKIWMPILCFYFWMGFFFFDY